MRNLRNEHRSVLKCPSGLQLTASTWDGDSIICAFGPNKDDALLELKRWEKASASGHQLKDFASWDAPCPLPDLECDKILDLHYFPDSLTACLVLAGGDIIVVREEPQSGEEKIEIVGSVDAGISAAAWAPDDELLAITTQANTFLYMTRDFENVADITFTSDDLKASKHVSVGWGKSETQFKGKRARLLRDPTMPEKVDEGILSECDARNTTITWRGDGAYVAVNSVESGTRRVIRVYSREGILDSVSEPVDGLESALSWRPAGNLIAGIQRFEHRLDVVFFERNGLRHGQFALRLTKEEMDDWGRQITLKWNIDSSVLAVLLNDRIQLWTMGNYHYYLKQEIFPFSESPTNSVSLVWHTEKPLRFAICTANEVQNMEYNLAVGNGPTIPPDDYGVVAVIDGRSLRVTPLRLANVPPPMALHDVNLPSNALDVTVTRNILHGSVVDINVLTNSEILTYDWNVFAKPPVPPKLRTSKKSPYIQDISMERHQSTQTNGDVHSLNIQSKHNDENPTKEVVEFCLSGNGSLHASHRLLTKNCTSYLVTPAHLIFTTSQNLLKFVHMGGVEELEVPLDTPETDERCRSIERGARLITVMPSIFALVLQMPRGNLETIYPRALVLAGIRLSLNEKKYKKAFLACRNHRVDMNILHDYAPKEFIADVGLFVDQIKKVEHIDLFLSQLREEDVSKTMYRETLKTKLLETEAHSEAPPLATHENTALSKVNQICHSFLETLESRRSTHLQNIITAHVCKLPPDLNAGLSMIAKMQVEDPDRIDRAVEHICFLADINRLYDNALGLYDLQLTLLTAQQSQKDPREYLPFLQNLQEMSELRRRYSIDNHLGRHRKALKHLYDLDDSEGVKSYMSKHDLYADALELYRYREDDLLGIMQLYAEYLQRESKYKDAGITFEYLANYSSASECYRLAHCWKEALLTANLVPLPSTQLHSLALTLADNLLQSKDYFSAATIHLDYLSDIPNATRLFCKGYFFTDALRTATLHQRPDLLESVIDAGLIEGMASMTELLAECKSQLNAQIPRIRELRTKKSEDPLGFFDGDVNNGADIPDNVSLAATDASTAGGGSLFTRYTNRTGTVGTGVTRRTSKNRRREERKRARGKKGSVYEEEYLVNSVGRLVERVGCVGEEVGRLVEGLVRRRMRERARAVQGAMEEVVRMCRGCVGEVFQGGGNGVEADGEDAAERPKGGDGVLWDSLEGRSRREAPVVKEFAKLHLLGS